MYSTPGRVACLSLLFLIMLLTGLTVPGVAAASEPVIVQSRGVDQGVVYQDLAKYGPWDDRNYGVTKEDLAWLAKNELELYPGIPVFFRVELRKEFPHLKTTGPVQYPRAALQLFRLR